MKYKIKRLVALLLSVFMFVTIIPFPSYAAITYEIGMGTGEVVGSVCYTKSNGDVYQSNICYVQSGSKNGEPFFGFKYKDGNKYTVVKLIYNFHDHQFDVYAPQSSNNGDQIPSDDRDSYKRDARVNTLNMVSENKLSDSGGDQGFERSVSGNRVPSWGTAEDSYYSAVKIVFSKVKSYSTRMEMTVTDPWSGGAGWNTTLGAYTRNAGTVAMDIIRRHYIANENVTAKEFVESLSHMSGKQKEAWDAMFSGVIQSGNGQSAFELKDDTKMSEWWDAWVTEYGTLTMQANPANYLGSLYAYVNKATSNNRQQVSGDRTGTMQTIVSGGLAGASQTIGQIQIGATVTEDSGAAVENGNGNTLVWQDWYTTALCLITGVELKDGIFDNVVVEVDSSGNNVPKEVNGQTIPLYGSYENLQELMHDRPDDENARKEYEVLSLLLLGEKDHKSEIEAWYGDSFDAIKDRLKDVWGEVKTTQNDAVQDNGALGDLVTKITEFGNVTDENMRRFSSISQRLRALIINLSQEDTGLDTDQFEWVSSYYDDAGWFLYADMLDEKAIPYIQVNGGTNPKFATAIGTDQHLLGYYIIYTLYEIPYFTEYYLKDMNDAISSNSELTNNDLYKAVKSIYDAKESLKMPMLDYLWTREMEPAANTSTDNIQYKSLEKIWEAMNKLTDGASIEDTPEASKPLETGKPMKWFFEDYNAGKLSDYYLQGIAYSAILVPMRSNVYSKEWLRYMDYEFFSDFYYKWGFNRKALLIDRSSGSVESYFNQSGEERTRGRTKVCTLRDLVESKGDVTLYLDDNFYNCQEIKTRYDAMAVGGNRANYNSGALDTSMATDDTTAESGNEEKYTNNVFDRYGWWTTVAASIEEMYGTDFENIVKTNESTNYSKTFYDMMSKLDGGHVYYPEATADNVGNNDNAVLSSGRINYYLNSENAGSEVYSPIQGYAVVSSVYRDADLFNRANSAEIQRPVFMASQTAPYMKNASLEACETIFNWALLKNLKDAMPVGYAGNIDMDCPVYMDILGNIVTESGTVVVPAAANATIMNPDTYYSNMYSAGLFSIYGFDYYIPIKENESDVFQKMMQVAFEPDDSGKYYIASPRTVGNENKIDMSRLSATSKSTLDILYQQTWATLYNMESNKSGYNFDNYFNICVEVLRGAPIESIDKEAEGIDTSNRIDRAGIVAAAKLEELNEALATGAENTTLYIPNIAFMPGFTYIAMMAFKILMLVVILVSMVTVYFDAVSEQLGVSTMMKCIGAMLITMITIFTVPAVFEATYYQSNRALLQDEAIRIAMLNYEKSAAGVEIGVTEVREPEMETELFVKLEDIEVPWYELFYNSIFTNSYASLESMYENYAKTHSVIAFADDVEVKNDGVYVDVQTIFDSSSVDLSMNVENLDIRRLVQTASVQTTSLSYYSPYYAILDALIQNVNYYNDNPWGESSGDASSGTTGWYSYTTTEQKGGKIKTMGLIEPYFTSEKFLYDDDKDPLGLKMIYKDIADSGVAPDPAIYGFYSDGNLMAMHRSGWYASTISSTECQKRLEHMTEQARRFVAKNQELIGKISDDTFLKAMALSMAIEHNRTFGAASCESVEIYNLSNDDLIRLSIADRDEVMINSTLSYPRFVYTVGGTPAVFVAALLSMVMWVSGLVKPILVIVAFLTIFVSIFVFRVCMRKEGTSLYGYMITALLLSLTNIAYSLLLKASMFLPTLHFTPFMCLIVQIVLQIAYMVLLLNVVGTAFKDWRDLGYARYANKTQDMRIGFLQMFSKTKNTSNPFYGGTTKRSDPEKNWNYYDEMMEERKRRSS